MAGGSASACTVVCFLAGGLTALGLVGVSCSGDVAHGGVGQDCYPNGTCNQGLSCYSNLCVDARSGAGGLGGSAGRSGGGAGGISAGGTGGSSTGGRGGSSTGGAGGQGTGGTGGGIAGAGGDGGAAGGGSGTSGSAGTGGGVVDAGRDTSACVVVDAGPAESFDVAACGYNPTTTTNNYSGVVTLTVSGVLVNSPSSSLLDAFYALDWRDTSVALEPYPDGLRYNLFNEAACVCSTECSTTSHRVADLLLGPYPPFNPSHVYTVQLDLGTGSPAPLRFGMADCGCNDNSGTWAITLQPAVCGS